MQKKLKKKLYQFYVLEYAISRLGDRYLQDVELMLSLRWGEQIKEVSIDLLVSYQQIYRDFLEQHLGNEPYLAVMATYRDDMIHYQDDESVLVTDKMLQEVLATARRILRHHYDGWYSRVEGPVLEKAIRFAVNLRKTAKGEVWADKGYAHTVSSMLKETWKTNQTKSLLGIYEKYLAEDNLWAEWSQGERNVALSIVISQRHHSARMGQEKDEVDYLDSLSCLGDRLSRMTLSQLDRELR